MLPDGYGWMWTMDGILQSTSDAGRHWRLVRTEGVSLDAGAIYGACMTSDKNGDLLVWPEAPINLYGTQDNGSSWQLQRSWVHNRFLG
jgi:photosystem II stability/assembly factor-like uncharacterized protein